MALLQLLHKPCFAFAVTGATAHFLQRALRSSLVFFLRAISSGLKSSRLFVLIFFPISHLLQAKRILAHFEQYPVWSAGKVWQYAQAFTALGFPLAAGLLCFVLHWVQKRHMPSDSTRYHSSWSQAETNSRSGNSFSCRCGCGLQPRQNNRMSRFFCLFGVSFSKRAFASGSVSFSRCTSKNVWGPINSP